MYQISDDMLQRALPYPELIDALSTGFQSDIFVPVRHHHHMEKGTTLLIMPAWQSEEYLGIKLVTVFPNNHQYTLPTIQGIYLLYSARNGCPIAQMDAKILTNIRTAATSVLAAKQLARTDSKNLLILGAGSLMPFFIDAYLSAFPLENIWIWGRNFNKTTKKTQSLNPPIGCNIEAIPNKDKYIPQADIIVSITLSESPIIKGTLLKEGQHLDLVGSYKPNMQEADDDCILKATIFVDSKETALKESGDLCIPIQKGLLDVKDIKADLFDLGTNSPFKRSHSQEITLFKSVGNALEDLVAAQMAYEKVIDFDHNP